MFNGVLECFLQIWFCVFSQKSGRIEEEAELLEHKLKTLEQEMGFGGRIVRAKRVQGKHVTMTVEQETARFREIISLFSRNLESNFSSLELALRV